VSAGPPWISFEIEIDDTPRLLVEVVAFREVHVSVVHDVLPAARSVRDPRLHECGAYEPGRLA